MAKSGHYIYRDAGTGRLVTEAYASAHPGTGGPRMGRRLMAGKSGKSKGSVARSAKSGKFVTPGYAKAHPNTTVVSKKE